MALLIAAQAAILQELARKPGWGEGLRERIRDRAGDDAVPSRGALVAALRELLDKKLIEEAGEETRGGLGPQAGGTPRRLYRITTKGLEEVARQRAVAAAVFRMGEAGDEDETPKRWVEPEE